METDLRQIDLLSDLTDFFTNEGNAKSFVY